MKYNSKINIRCEDKLKNKLELMASKEEMKFADYIRWLLRIEANKDNQD